eukprot:jgi/Psemu1/310399/fgenesh1_kg.635_\
MSMISIGRRCIAVASLSSLEAELERELGLNVPGNSTNKFFGMSGACVPIWIGQKKYDQCVKIPPAS